MIRIQFFCCQCLPPPFHSCLIAVWELKGFALSSSSSSSVNFNPQTKLSLLFLIKWFFLEGTPLSLFKLFAGCFCLANAMVHFANLYVLLSVCPLWNNVLGFFVFCFGHDSPCKSILSHYVGAVLARFSDSVKKWDHMLILSAILNDVSLDRNVVRFGIWDWS